MIKLVVRQVVVAMINVAAFHDVFGIFMISRKGLRRDGGNNYASLLLVRGMKLLQKKKKVLAVASSGGESLRRQMLQNKRCLNFSSDVAFFCHPTDGRENLDSALLSFLSDVDVANTQKWKTEISKRKGGLQTIRELISEWILPRASALIGKFLVKVAGTPQGDRPSIEAAWTKLNSGRSQFRVPTTLVDGGQTDISSPATASDQHHLRAINAEDNAGSTTGAPVSTRTLQKDVVSILQVAKQCLDARQRLHNQKKTDENCQVVLNLRHPQHDPVTHLHAENYLLEAKPYVDAAWAEWQEACRVKRNSLPSKIKIEGPAQSSTSETSARTNSVFVLAARQAASSGEVEEDGLETATTSPGDPDEYEVPLSDATKDEMEKHRKAEDKNFVEAMTKRKGHLSRASERAKLRNEVAESVEQEAWLEALKEHAEIMRKDGETVRASLNKPVDEPSSNTPDATDPSHLQQNLLLYAKEQTEDQKNVAGLLNELKGKLFFENKSEDFNILGPSTAETMNDVDRHSFQKEYLRCMREYFFGPPEKTCFRSNPAPDHGTQPPAESTFRFLVDVIQSHVDRGAQTAATADEKLRLLSSRVASKWLTEEKVESLTRKELVKRLGDARKERNGYSLKLRQNQRSAPWQQAKRQEKLEQAEKLIDKLNCQTKLLDGQGQVRAAAGNILDLLLRAENGRKIFLASLVHGIPMQQKLCHERTTAVMSKLKEDDAFFQDQLKLAEELLASGSDEEEKKPLPMYEQLPTAGDDVHAPRREGHGHDEHMPPRVVAQKGQDHEPPQWYSEVVNLIYPDGDEKRDSYREAWFSNENDQKILMLLWEVFNYGHQKAATVAKTWLDLVGKTLEGVNEPPKASATGTGSLPKEKTDTRKGGKK
ncbi:unnamed protein product [Amoebophrya sp. A25]|nr:unnamed protein product [Amoebophrya sp. A25]|eukprot:GSA25T00013159001.1